MTAERRQSRSLARNRAPALPEADAGELRRLLFDLSEDAIILLDRDGRLLSANPKALSLFPELASAEPMDAMPAIVVMDGRGGLDDLRRIAGKPGAEGTVRVGDTILEVSETSDESRRLLRLADATERLSDQRRIMDAVESLPGGFTLFDTSDRLVFANATYLREYSDSYRSGGDPLGARGADLIAASIRAGLTQSGSAEDVEAYISRRLARRINPPLDPHVYRRPDGKWAAVYERRTPDGSLAAIRIDVTEQKHAESLLSHSIEHIDEALSLWDEKSRLILYNSRYADLHFPGRHDTDFRGLSFEEVQRSVYGTIYEGPAAPEERAAGLRRSLELWNSEDNYSRELRLVDGRVIGVRCVRTKGGGRASIYTDITTVRTTEDALREAIDSFGEGFVLSGQDDRIIIHNQRYLEMFESLRGKSLVGRTTSEIASALRMESGKPRGWNRNRRISRSGGDGAPVEIRMADGRWLSFRDQKTRSGGVATLITDVTREKESEERLRRSETSLKTVIEGSLQATIIHADGKALFRNAAFRDLWSHHNEDDALDHPSSIASGDSLFKNIDKEGGPVARSAAWVLTAGGRRICVDYRSLLIDWLGKPATMTAIIDVTDRVYAHHLLKQSETKFRDITACATDFHWEVDRDLRIAEVSDRVIDLFGIEPSHFFGRSILKMFGSGTRKADLAKTFAAIRSGQPFREHVHSVRLPDGTVRTVRSNGTPVVDANGRIKGYRGASSDITQEVADALRRQAAERFTVLGTAVGSIAHEINNQLQVIRGFAEQIMQGLGGRPEFVDLLQYGDWILDAANEARVVANRVLASSKGKVIDRVTIDIATEARDLIEAQMKLLTDVEIRFSNDLARHVRIRLAREELSQVISNLTINARHATGPNGVIIVTLEEVRTSIPIEQPVPDAPPAPPGDYVRLSFQDNGCGMSEETQAKIFDRFFTTKGIHGGTGLGLPIVYELVKSMNGAIEVASTLGIGTIFRIYMPLFIESSEKAP